MKTEPTISIQDEVAKIHAQYGTTEMANYRIEKLLEKYIEQSSPKIKQLEWEYLKSYYRSDSSIYKYAITHANDFKTDVGLYSLLINGEFLNYYAELNEAKQFAQADFERRIKECLITEL